MCVGSSGRIKETTTTMQTPHASWSIHLVSPVHTKSVGQRYHHHNANAPHIMVDSSRVSRACDICRARKIRCDGMTPCSSCRIARHTCQYRMLVRKRGPKPTRFTRAPSNTQRHATSSAFQIPDSQPSTKPQNCTVIATSSDHGIRSADTQASPTFSKSPSLILPNPPAGLITAVREELLAAASLAPLDRHLERCLDFYVQYVFPTAPFIHEGALRAFAPKFAKLSLPEDFFQDERGVSKVFELKQFTLATALCAAVGSTAPKDMELGADTTSISFLRSSRLLLQSYEDYDTEHPDSSSLAIRVLQSTALQHTTGRFGAAFHVLGQAGLLAQTLRLHEEQSVMASDPIEAQLLKSIFLHLCSADQAAFCLKTRPSLLYDVFLSANRGEVQHQNRIADLLSTKIPYRHTTLESCLWEGFQLQVGLWSCAARILAEIEALEKAPTGREEICSRLKLAYGSFLAIPDNLPVWLHASTLRNSPQNSHERLPHIRSFWMQRCTLTTSYQCLKVLITQQFIDHGLFDILGLLDEPMAIWNKKIEVIQECIRAVEDIPLLYHLIKGEPNVNHASHCLEENHLIIL